MVKFIKREKKAIKLLLKKVKPQDFPLILGRLYKEDRLELILLLPDEVIKGFIAKLPLEILLELPVVDDNNVLLGVVTVDDVVDVIINESTEDLVKFGGSAQRVTAPYPAARVVELVSKRAVWLMLLYLFEAITATILSRFERIISTVVALSFFIPLIVGTGGNSGSQASSFVVRALATGEVTVHDVLRVLMKESVTSLMLGLTVSPLAFAISLLVTREAWIAITVSMAIVLVVFIASVIGSLLPILVARIKIDPASLSSPLLATTTDRVGLSMYFTLALAIFRV